MVKLGQLNTMFWHTNRGVEDTFNSFITGRNDYLKKKGRHGHLNIASISWSRSKWELIRLDFQHANQWHFSLFFIYRNDFFLETHVAIIQKGNLTRKIGRKDYLFAYIFDMQIDDLFNCFFIHAKLLFWKNGCRNHPNGSIV